MNNVLKLGKKIFTFSVVATTIMWSLGVATLVPTVAQAADVCPAGLAAGDIVKVGSLAPLYTLGSDLKLLSSIDNQVVKIGTKNYYFSGFKSWNVNDSYGTIKNITTECYGTLGMAGKAFGYRPGAQLLKHPVTNKLMVVLPGRSWAYISDAAATALYGYSSSMVLPPFTANDLLYAFDAGSQKSDITESVAHDGMYVKQDSKVYYVNGTKLVEMTEAGLAANRVRTSIMRTVPTTGLTVDTVKYDAYVPALSDRTNQGLTPAVPATGGTIQVSLAADTPAAGYIAKGAYNADFTKVSFKNVSSATVRVDKLVVTRGGLGTDNDITAIRIYDASAQLGSDQALNTTSHLVNFNNLNWDIAAGASKTLTIKGDTVIAASGTNDYLGVTAVELEGSGTISATLPINGNAMQYHSVSVGTVDVDANATPGATTLISGSTDQQLACFNFDVGANEAVKVKSVSFTNNDTIGNDELSNFVVKEGITVLGTNTGTFGTNNKVTVDFTTPYAMKKSTNKDLCVYGDIKSGITVTKYIKIQIAESKDVIVTGDDSKAEIVVTSGNGSVFTAENSAQMTIGQGALTVALNSATMPVATSLIDGVPHNRVAAYKFSAGSTEGVKVTRFRLTASAVTSADWSNFELYKYDDTTGLETPVGSSQSISGSTITFEDTSDGLFDVAASKNVVIHVYADVATAADWTTLSAGVYIGATNSNIIIKAKGLKSGDYIPAASTILTSMDTSGVLFTNANNGHLTISAANDNPVATNLARGYADKDYLHVKLYATGEDVNVTSLVVRAYEDATNLGGVDALDASEISNVRLYDISGATPVILGTAVSSPAAGVSTFNFTLAVPKDGYKTLKVLADVPSSGYPSYTQLMVTSTPLPSGAFSDITATGKYSGVDFATSTTAGKTGNAVGNVMTIAAPSIVASWASGVTNNVVANAQNVALGTLQLTAGQYEDVKVNSIKISADDATPISLTSSCDTNFTGFYLAGSDGTQYGVTKNLTSGSPDSATFDGIANLTVTKGTTKVIYVKANVAGTSGDCYVGTTSTADIVGSGATSGTSATITGTGQGQKNTINSAATLTFALDASNPATKLVAVGASGSGAEDTFMVLSADSLYEDATVTQLVFQAVASSTSDLVQQAFADNGVKLYHKIGSGSEVLIGSASLVSSTAAGLGEYYTATFNINEPDSAGNGGLIIGKSSDDLLIVKGLLRGTDDGLTSAVSPLFRFGNNVNANDTTFVTAKGRSSGTAIAVGSINGSSALNLSSNQLKVYKAYPTFTYVNPGTTLVNGVENDIYSFKVRANGGNIALKQMQFNIDVVDNVGTSDNSISVNTFKLYRGDVNITDNVQIVSSTAGANLKLATNYFATTTGNTFYINWPTTGEEAIPSGAEYTYTIKATCSGFATDADNDYVRVRLANTDTLEQDQALAKNYLSVWSANTGLGNLLTFSNSAGVTEAALRATSTPASLIWSDKSASGHSAATTTYLTAPNSTGDWFDGYYVKDTPTNYSMLTR